MISTLQPRPDDNAQRLLWKIAQTIGLLSFGGCVLPVAPGSLAVVAGTNQNTLTWTTVADATSYNIKRALVTGGPYTTIDTDTASPYVDSAVSSGTDYFYVVSAVNACGESANSNEAHGVPTGDFQWTPVAQNVDWTDGGGAHTGNLANFNATAVKATTTIIQFNGHAVETISYFGEGNLPTLATYTSAACNSLTSINSPDLTSLTGLFSSLSCPALTSVNLSGLISVTSYITIQTANVMTSLNLSSLTSVGGLYLDPVNSLVTLNVPSLTTTLDFYTKGSTNLLTINAPALTAITTNYFCESCPALTTANFQSLQTVGGSFYAHTNPNMTSLNVSSLVTVGVHLYAYASKLTTLSCPALTGVGGGFRFDNSTLLANVSLPVFVPKNSNTIRFDGCALTAASVNHILARCVANAAFTTATVLLNAGTNSAPTGQGILDKATLIARGCGVATN